MKDLADPRYLLDAADVGKKLRDGETAVIRRCPMFKDRRDAGVRLASLLERFQDSADAIVLAIPRGGVVVGSEVAKALGLPLDVVVVRKIGAPGNPEYAVGAMDEDGGILRSPVARVPDDYLVREAEVNRAEIERRVEAYREGRPAPQLSGKTVILVDDGIATGLTALKAISFVRSRGASRVVLATPVVARATASALAGAADELVAVDRPYGFSAVGQFYDVFTQTSDAEVQALLAGTEARNA